MQLLLPGADLVGVAVEGLEPGDQARAARETVEIADLVLYYGGQPQFTCADGIAILQFKYTVAVRQKPFRAADAKKTIRKFAAAYSDHRRAYGARAVAKKLTFELVTNRRVFPPFARAIEGVATGTPLTGQAKKQAEQFTAACDLEGKLLAEFASKCVITGLAENLSDSKNDLSRMLVDWSAARDARAGSRLGALRQLVRDKAGHAGSGRNLITRTDILAALELSGVEDLLPCPASLPEVGPVVKREQLPTAIDLVPSLDRPLLVHGVGGTGKTVFMESLASALSPEHEVVFFDCFGGGAYRAPEDARHLPKRGMVHITNSLACRGLCDPLLPGCDDVESVVAAFRKRLSHCTETLRRTSSTRRLLLFIDAVDNAAQEAADRGQAAFPTLLLQSLLHNGQIPGLCVVVSARSHRIDLALKDVPYRELALRTFSRGETTTYLEGRVRDVTQTEIQVAQSRSAGNPRILEHLAQDRGLLDKAEAGHVIELDDLLSARIDGALQAALGRGYDRKDTADFLAGLAVLPPPVPLDEYAGAHGLTLSAVESFAADLAPLLERTRHGLMFRDEPTETHIRDRYASDASALQRVAENLLARQSTSVYAARALPGLLRMLGDDDRLFDLAFDRRFPATITSAVGRRNIRFARLTAAVAHAATRSDHNQLVHLMVELSTLAASDSRGADYILDYPDLVVAARDVDATRRLFEIRTNWPGARHARLAIAETLSGNFDDAYRHARSTEEWLHHHLEQDNEPDPRQIGPERLDVAAIPFCLITQGRSGDAARFLRRWRDWYAYEVGESLFGLVGQAHSLVANGAMSAFLDTLSSENGLIAAALSFVDLDKRQRVALIEKLARGSRKLKDVKSRDSYYLRSRHDLQDGLLKIVGLAAALRLEAAASTILRRVPAQRPGMWAFRGHFTDGEALPFVLYVALAAAARGTEVRAKEVLPRELVPLARGTKATSTAPELAEKLKARLNGQGRRKRAQAAAMSYEDKQRADRFIGETLGQILSLTSALAKLLARPTGRADKAFGALVEAWANARATGERYEARQFNRLSERLGCEVSMFALWVRSDLKPDAVKAFLVRLREQQILGAPTLISVVEVLATRPPLHVLAGEAATLAREIIESEDDVDSRSSLYADLGRAILPASVEEATALFRRGLDQMDAIGSGDYALVNELLEFAAALRGPELGDSEVHTLANICELNIPGDSEKFPWGAFGRGLARAAGPKGLAKLGRWDDRGKVGLDYTLLPYLAALVSDGKLDAKYAVALNGLAEPAEWWHGGTEQLARAIAGVTTSDRGELIQELVTQFEENNQHLPPKRVAKALADIAGEVLGQASECATRLTSAHAHSSRVLDERNDNRNYRTDVDPGWRVRAQERQRSSNRTLLRLVKKTDPIDETSLAAAIGELEAIEGSRVLTEEFLERLRQKVPFADRARYMRVLSRVEDISLHPKLTELQRCKTEWAESSGALPDALSAIGPALVRQHAADLVGFGNLSVSRLREIADLSSIAVVDLALEMTKVLATEETGADASVWLALASLVSDLADGSEGVQALKRLLKSEAAQLSSTVADGRWIEGLYPTGDDTGIVSGLIWRMLGAPSAADRWRAAHCVRRLARLGTWNVVDALVARISSTEAHPFQAPELPFFFMHARLWLIVALARIALDQPHEVSRYQSELLRIAEDASFPHVLMRHFAARTLIACMDQGTVSLSDRRERQVRSVDRSPLSRLSERVKRGGGFYHGRPDDAPPPKAKFHLDYDFDKLEVHGLSDVFGRPGWEVKDRLAEIVTAFDSSVKSMYDRDGRERRYADETRGMNARYHTHGQQLAWHSLFVVAGELLRKFPVTSDSYADEPWTEWLGSELLTRADGLWLSDGLDRSPLSVQANLLEKETKGLVLTGNKEKVLRLVGLAGGMKREVVVNGAWGSPDGIGVHVDSALVPSRSARSLAMRLISEEPVRVWLPTYSDHGEEEYLQGDVEQYAPWIVCPSQTPRLDAEDPVGARFAVQRPRFSQGIATAFSLRKSDPFGRLWTSGRGTVLARSEAWGPEKGGQDQGSGGTRLVCSRRLLRAVLAKCKADLLLLVKLSRYERGLGAGESSQSIHTVAVIRIKKTNLSPEYFRGQVNHIHTSRF